MVELNDDDEEGDDDDISGIANVNVYTGKRSGPSVTNCTFRSNGVGNPMISLLTRGTLTDVVVVGGGGAVVVAVASWTDSFVIFGVCFAVVQW